MERRLIGNCFFFRARHSIVRVQGQATEKRKAGQQHQPATEKNAAQHPHRRRTLKSGGTTPRSTPDPKRKRRPPRPHTQRPQTLRPQRGKPTQSGAAARPTVHRPCSKTRAGPVHERALYTRGPKSPKGGHTRSTEALYRNCHANGQEITVDHLSALDEGGQHRLE